jgi:hypothetical protein
VSNLLKEIDKEDYEEKSYLKDITEKDIKSTAGEMFVAGSDTVSLVNPIPPPPSSLLGSLSLHRLRLF